MYPGQEETFKQVWREELAGAFRKANPMAQGTLIQSLETPQIFYSFGPWESMEAARNDPVVRQAIGKLLALCTEANPGPYRVIPTIP